MIRWLGAGCGRPQYFPCTQSCWLTICGCKVELCQPGHNRIILIYIHATKKRANYASETELVWIVLTAVIWQNNVYTLIYLLIWASGFSGRVTYLHCVIWQNKVTTLMLNNSSAFCHVTAACTECWIYVVLPIISLTCIAVQSRRACDSQLYHDRHMEINN